MQFVSNPKSPRGESAVSIRKRHNRIGFSVGFVKDARIDKSYMYCYVTLPEKEKDGFKVGFIFAKDAELIPGVNPFKLQWHPSGNSFQVFTKYWFDQASNIIGNRDVDGTYNPIQKIDPKIGVVHYIYLK